MDMDMDMEWRKRALAGTKKCAVVPATNSTETSDVAWWMVLPII